MFPCITRNSIHYKEMTKLKSKSIIYISLSIISIILIDQLSKASLIAYFSNVLTPNIEIFIFLDFIPMWNSGIGFGFLQKYKYSNMVFLIINTFILVYLSFILIKKNIKNIYIYLTFIFVIGGGISNNLDRIFRGSVFDFIWVHYKNFSFPVFNVADLFISLGSIFLILFFFQDVRQKNKV